MYLSLFTKITHLKHSALRLPKIQQNSGLYSLTASDFSSYLLQVFVFKIFVILFVLFVIVGLVQVFDFYHCQQPASRGSARHVFLKKLHSY